MRYSSHTVTADFGDDCITRNISNMLDEVLKIKKRDTDLVRCPEYWESSSFEEKRRVMEEKFLECKNYPIHQNVKLFREMTFMVKASVSIGKVRKLCDIIRQRYKLECFQISIDREMCEAHLLFVWADESLKSIVLQDCDLRKLSVLVLRYLNLPRPKSMKTFVKFFLKDAYELDTDVFSNQLDLLSHARIPGINYSLVADALTYAEYMCKGELK